MDRQRLRIAILFLLAGALLYASPASALKNLAPGDTLPDVRIVTSGGEALPVSRLLGPKGGLMVFWATWNPRSPEMLQYLAGLQTRYKKHGYVVIPVNVEHEDSAADEMRRFADTYASWALPWPTYFDPGLDVFAAFGVITLPTLVYLNPELQITGTYPGFPGEAQDAVPMLIEQGLGIWEPAVEVGRPVEVRYTPQDGAGAVFQMGRLMHRKGRREKAAAYFQKAATLDPEYPDPLAAQAYLAHLAGDAGTEQAALAALREKSGNQVSFQEAYGLSLLATERTAEAKTALEPLATLPEPRPKGLVGLALIRAVEGDLDAAEQWVERLQAWPLGGVPLKIDVTAYLDPEVPPEQRWQDPDLLIRRLLELE